MGRRRLRPGQNRKVADIVVITTASAAISLVPLAFVSPAGPSLAAWPLLVLLAVAFFVLHVADVLLPWGREQLAISLDEVVYFLALALLPAIAAPLLLVPGVAFAQVIKRRPLHKGMFNVATHVLGAALGALVFAALVTRFGIIAGALAGTAVYSVSTQALVVTVLARISGDPFLAVVRRRLAGPLAFQVGLGGAGGLIALALWAFHPAALLALVPFVLLARAYARHHERAARVMIVHERVRALSQALRASDTTVDIIARQVLAASADLLDPADATVTLTPRSGAEQRTWRHSSAAAWSHEQGFVAPVVGPSGRLYGTLRVDAPSRDDAMGPATLRLLAEQAGSALDRL